MMVFLSDAFAATAATTSTSAANSNASFFMLGAIVLVFYFLMIRPQNKRAKEQKDMLAQLAKGDEVVTNGGILGKITALGEQFITLQLAEGVAIKVQRAAVTTVVPKGTCKDA